ncbi:hypothetical protein [Kitasatospora griseola]|uniref:hypothetical protein n=1 Tax=Kitasatospora griseola TaxID=2064 RepID=UPI0036651F9A
MQRHRRHRPSRAPQAVRSADLSFALNELDAQVANLPLYEQSFLDKTRAVVRFDGAIPATYDARLRPAAADAHRAQQSAVPFDGLLGTELRNITFLGEQDAAEAVLAAFQCYQPDRPDHPCVGGSRAPQGGGRQQRGLQHPHQRHPRLRPRLCEHRG